MNITPKNVDETGRAYALRILKQNISDTTLRPGTLLSENELSKMLGLSRVPVREALIELSKSDIIEILPQRGSRVALIDLKLVDEAGFFRRTLECAVVKLVCEKAAGKSFRTILCSRSRQILTCRISTLKTLSPISLWSWTMSSITSSSHALTRSAATECAATWEYISTGYVTWRCTR